MNEPGEDETPGHPEDYVAEEAKLGLAFSLAIHAAVFLYLSAATGMPKRSNSSIFDMKATSAKLKGPARYSLPSSFASIMSKHLVISALALSIRWPSRSPSGLRISWMMWTK